MRSARRITPAESRVEAGVEVGREGPGATSSVAARIESIIKRRIEGSGRRGGRWGRRGGGGHVEEVPDCRRRGRNAGDCRRRAEGHLLPRLPGLLATAARRQRHRDLAVVCSCWRGRPARVRPVLSTLATARVPAVAAPADGAGAAAASPTVAPARVLGREPPVLLARVAEAALGAEALHLARRDAAVLATILPCLLALLLQPVTIVQKVGYLSALLAHCATRGGGVSLTGSGFGGGGFRSGRWRRDGTRSRVRTVDALVHTTRLHVLEIAHCAELVHVVTSVFDGALRAVAKEVLEEGEGLRAEVRG